jgi:F-type H+-transporting ATPase subunit delta
MSVDDKHKLSQPRASAVVTVLSEFVDRKYALKKYFKLLKNTIQDNTLIIEYAGAYDEKEMKAIKWAVDAIKGHEVDLIARENPELIAGIRVFIGDEIYDSSIRTRLNSIA